MALWTCPSCSRKVPAYAAACHCGVTRVSAHSVAAAPPPPVYGPRRFTTRDFPWQVWVALGVIVVAMGVGVWQLLRKGSPERLPALLGRVDEPLPSPTATPKPRDRPSPYPMPSPTTSPS